MPAQAATKPPDGPPRIERHKTALSRTDFSRPIARALFDGLITEETTVFDYGCGRGGDVKRLSEMSIDVAGFDPNFAPETELRNSRIVNLGFVVNVIEDPKERAEVLLKAWELTEGILIVSARLRDEARGLWAKDYGDGVLTGRATFQKFFEQDELREWIKGVLGLEPIAAEPGVFYVFRHPPEAQLFLLTRVRRTPPAPKKSEAVFDEHQELMNELMRFFEENGRLPRAGEFSLEGELKAKVGTARQAFRTIKHLTGDECWDRVRVKRYEDLLVWLCLLQVRGGVKYSELPRNSQYDIKDFFGSYKAALAQSSGLLASLAHRERIKAATESVAFGVRAAGSLFINCQHVKELPPLLRLMDALAKSIAGDTPESGLIRIETASPRVTYLVYPDFQGSSKPSLSRARAINLATLEIKSATFTHRKKPIVLRNKEKFLNTLGNQEPSMESLML